jgi:hypothetical protein
VIRPGTWRPVWPGLGRRHRLDVRVSSPVLLHEALGLTGPVSEPDDELVDCATALLHELLTAQVQTLHPVVLAAPALAPAS